MVGIRAKNLSASKREESCCQVNWLMQNISSHMVQVTNPPQTYCLFIYKLFDVHSLQNLLHNAYDRLSFKALQVYNSKKLENDYHNCKQEDTYFTTSFNLYHVVSQHLQIIFNVILSSNIWMFTNSEHVSIIFWCCWNSLKII